METTTSYERFPAPVVVLSNLVAVSIYAIGAYVLAGLGIWVSGLFLLYCLWIELRVLRRSCVNCYYYGRVCAFGKGKICALFFQPGDPARFAEKEVSWSDLVPDFLVLIVPLIGGIAVLIRGFDWMVVILLAVLVLLSTAGNGLIRGSFACRYCKQREIGCPAEKLFSKGKAQPKTL